MDSDKQVEERQQAFELLDALTKSGSIRIDDCSLHVVMASTHCFDQSLLDTVMSSSVARTRLKGWSRASL